MMDINQDQSGLNRTGFKHLVGQLGVQAGMIYHGQLCGVLQFTPKPGVAHLHLVRRGNVSITQDGEAPIHISTPSVIFFPRSTSNHINTAIEPNGADLTCAEIRYAIGQNNLLINAFKPVMVFDLARWPFLLSIIELIEKEQQSDHIGGSMICNQLMNVFVIYMLRYACEDNPQQSGIIALLSHKHFGGLVEQIFSDIAYPWQLENMAKVSCMSRASFAKQFKLVSGQTPNEFLSHNRLQTAMRELQKGQSIQFVANHIGYSSISALNKLFAKYVGISPKQWINERT